jgi:hypothetical protein
MNSAPDGDARASAGEHAVPGYTEAAAWSMRYHEYLERSITRALRAQDLNRELVRKVAAGQLAPWTIETHLSTFAATRAASYSQQIAQVTMAFLAGLIKLGSAYSHELVQAVLPGAPQPAQAAAPDFEPSRSADWFRDLTVFAAAENARATAMLRTVMDKVVAGELAPLYVEQASSRFHQDYLPGSTGQLVELYLDLLNGLEEVHASFSEEYLRSLLGPVQGVSPPPENAVAVDAILGEDVSIRFAVTNTDLDPAVVACTLSGIRRADGVGPAFDPAVRTTPGRLELAPGAEATVELTIHAGADHFQAGEFYEGVFRVANATRTLLELPLRIRALEPQPHAQRPEQQGSPHEPESANSNPRQQPGSRRRPKPRQSAKPLSQPAPAEQVP